MCNNIHLSTNQLQHVLHVSLKNIKGGKINTCGESMENLLPKRPASAKNLTSEVFFNLGGLMV